jgi:VCBS repeat-containing protein
VLDTNTGITVNEGGQTFITTTELSSSDIDNSAAQLTYNVTVSPTLGQLERNANPGVAITSFTQEEIDNGEILYVHAGGENTSDQFTFTVTDGAGGAVTATVFNITVTPVNDPPVIGTNNGLTLGEGATATITTALLEVTDVDSTPAQIEYTVMVPPTNGRLELTTSPGNDAVVFTQDDINNNRLIYIHDGGETTTDTIEFIVQDNDSGTIGNTGFNITITPANDAPTLDNSSTTYNTPQDQALLFLAASGDFLLNDNDVESGDIRMLLTVNNGTLTLPDVTGLTFLNSTTNGSATLEFSGNLANLQIALDGLTFTPTSGFTGDATLNFTVDDLGNTGSGGAQTATGSLTITVS